MNYAPDGNDAAQVSSPPLLVWVARVSPLYMIVQVSGPRITTAVSRARPLVNSTRCDHGALVAATMATLPFLVRPAVVRFAQFYCDAAHRQQLDELFAPKVGPLPGGEKELGEAREAIDVCIAKRAALGPAVSAFLGKQ